jgi:hypothetical protein
MLVYFLQIQRNIDWTKTRSIKDLQIVLGGKNAPLWTYLKGGDGNGCLYLICVDVNIDIDNICNQFGYKVYSIRHPIEISDEQYNSFYIPYINYFDNKPYELRHINDTEYVNEMLYEHTYGEDCDD